MALKDDIETNSRETFQSSWTERDGRTVPAPADVKLGNDAVKFERATVLYADLDQSTDLVDKKKWWFAAEVYKTFLYAASRLVRAEGGSIVSYDGDRVMGIFIGDSQCNDAVRCALKINYAVKSIVQPALDKRYPTADYKIQHVVGIDTSTIYAARTGVRGDNDLVWVGTAANHAAKLTALSADYPTWITDKVFEKLNGKQKYGGDPERLIWENRTWTAMGGVDIHRCNWHWSL